MVGRVGNNGTWSPQGRSVMGIVNCTPDSFYTGTGALPTRERLIAQLRNDVQAGVAILDLGGCSTRPGSSAPSVEEEWDRLKMGLAAAEEVLCASERRPLISIDTFRSEVARRAIEHFAADMINDVSGGLADERMYDLVAETGVYYVATHMRGTPQTMQQMTRYNDVVEEVAEALSARIEAMHRAGIRDERILLDPGFGFAKDAADNFRLVAGLQRLAKLGYPLLVGVSHKSMLSHATGVGTMDTQPATTALNWELLRQGASILRVHDVAAARQVIDLYNYYEKTVLHG